MDFDWIYKSYRMKLLNSEPVEVGEWHSQPTKSNPLLVTMEVPFVNFNFYVADSVKDLQEIVKPNLP